MGNSLTADISSKLAARMSNPDKLSMCAANDAIKLQTICIRGIRNMGRLSAMVCACVDKR